MGPLRADFLARDIPQRVAYQLVLQRFQTFAAVRVTTIFLETP
jgi:hypothetical protein